MRAGTLSESKLAAIRDFGVTRLSLGVENFDDRILELNGRAHRSPEIYRVFEQARALGFPQINIDLIAGMVGESDANWRACIDRTLELSPDSVTIYQMELPYNTTISGNLKGSGDLGGPIADWRQKRRWVTEAFEALEAAGYHVGSAYTAVKDPSVATFVYRDSLWEGADLVGLGVASFGHVNGVSIFRTWTPGRAYSAAIEAGDLPLGRAYRPNTDERLIREFILQLKRGSVRPGYFTRSTDRSARSLPRTAGLARSEGFHRADFGTHRAHAPRAAAGGLAAAPVLPAAARRHPLHVKTP